jgi:hypothetical protein
MQMWVMKNDTCKAYQFGKRSTTEVKKTKFHINRRKLHETKESIIWIYLNQFDWMYVSVMIHAVMQILI